MAVAPQSLPAPRPPDATRNPEAVRQPAITAARQRSGRPATPALDPIFVALNPSALPTRERPAAELHEWVRRDEEYAMLGVNVVVELNNKGRARQPTTLAWAIIRRVDCAHRLASQLTAASSAAEPSELTATADPLNPRSDRRWPMPTDQPAQPAGQRTAGTTPCV